MIFPLSEINMEVLCAGSTTVDQFMKKNELSQLKYSQLKYSCEIFQQQIHSLGYGTELEPERLDRTEIIILNKNKIVSITQNVEPVAPTYTNSSCCFAAAHRGGGGGCTTW